MALVAVHALLDEGPPAAQGSLPFDEPAQEEAPAEAPQDGEAAEEEPVPRKRKRRKDRPKWTYGNAHLASTYDSPKLREARIAVLNGETATDPATRQRIAEGFTTAEPPLYDIVIANRIAYEGVNLQTRTCSIFHGDLPYEPATLQQRNGRGQRQGNRYDVIDIYYVLSKRSSDMARFQLIAGKREWMAAIIESAASETNNPAAQADLSPEEWLLYLSRDVEKTRALLEKKKQEAEAAENLRLVKLAWASVRQIAMRQRDAKLSKDPIAKAHLLSEIDRISADLAQTDPLIWPWRFIAPLVAKFPTLSFAPSANGAVWESATLVRKRADGEQYGGGEFGAVSYQPNAIGFREFRRLKWESLSADEAQAVWKASTPKDWQDTPIAMEAELQPAVDQLLNQIERVGSYGFRELRLELASERFRVDFWNKWGLDLVRALLSAFDAERAQIPAKRGQPVAATLAHLSDDSTLIYPFTTEGLRAFLADCRAAGNLRWGEIDNFTDWWWGQRAPRNALTGTDSETGDDDGQI
jgi:hypothetical protein